MTETKLDRGIIFLLRILVGWTFLYAGSWQILQNYSAAGFLNHVVTFHDFFAHFAAPAVLPYTDFLMKWGHLLIGLSLVFGFMIRVSGPFGILLMITYYFAHMDWPYIENHLNFLCRFSPRLRGRDCLLGRASCWSCLGLGRHGRAAVVSRA
jgi:thiosulfate dehydrogenase [quinone] large subunit